MATGIDPNTGQPYDDAPDTNRDGPAVPGLPAPPPDGRKRYNLTPNWQDPFNPPSPGDPYYAEWWAANQDAGFPKPTASTTTTTGGIPATGRTSDDAAILAQIAKWAAMPDADPSLASNPQYWLGRIKDNGGLGADNSQYWQDAGVGANAFFRNPNREGGVKDVPLGNDNRNGDADWFSANLPAPAPYSTLGRPTGLSTPYTPGVWSETFKAPTLEDLQNEPGYQARLDAAMKGSQRSAAAQGSILSGGFQSRLGKEQQGIASQEYGNIFGRAYDTYQQKYGQFADNESRQLAARGLNEGTYQNDVTNNQNQYANRYRSYRDVIGDNFDLAKLGLDATTASRY